MGKIRIISKDRGSYESTSSTWEYLPKLTDGDISENENNIIITTVDNTNVDNIITINKEYIDSIEYIKKLIQNWCIRDDRYGLTLPNIIRAIRLNTVKINYSIDSFFNELPKVDLDIKISSCPDLDELVFGTFKKEDAPKNYYNEVNSIYYSKKDININSYEELINLFKNKYSEKIENGLYSKNYYTKKWSDLTEEDNNFLKSIK